MADTFGQLLLPWHDFFMLLGTSAAALLGLLFVSVSIHLDALTGDVQSLAHETFNQFFLLLLLMAVCLVPGLTPQTFAPALLVLGVLGAAAQVHHRRRRRQLGFPHPWRRELFPALAFALLVVTGGVLWATGAALMGALFAVGLLLISQATQNAWELLVNLGARAQAPISDSPGPDQAA